MPNARVALTQDDAFEFVSSDFTARLAITRVIHQIGGYSIEAIDGVRVFSIQLFSMLDLSNTERLVAVDWLCQQLDGLATTAA